MPERPSPIALPDPPLSDGVVTLRPWRRADIPTLVALCNDPLSARFTTIPAPYTTADANDWLGSHAGNLARGESVAFAVVEPPADTPVASIGMQIFDSGLLAGAAEVGYMTAPTARGRGIITRALGLVARWAFDDLGIERLQLTTHVDNPASQRVAEKCGFQREGLLRKYGLQRGERVDLVMFARLPGDRPQS